MKSATKVGSDSTTSNCLVLTFYAVGRYYNFTASGVGAYTFEPVNLFNLVSEDGTLSTITAETESATVDLSGQLSSATSLKASSLGGGFKNTARRGISKRATFSSCSATRQTQINAAITASSGYASKSITYVLRLSNLYNRLLFKSLVTFNQTRQGQLSRPPGTGPSRRHTIALFSPASRCAKRCSFVIH